MTVIGFHASHEQISPGRLLQDVQHAEQAGFEAAMCSDHFNPWSRAQGHSGFAWSWLGAALATTRLPFGTVSAPGQRYHPAVLAQAAATLATMFPGRFWMAPGSGEHLNESITGDAWPRKELRQQRLEECVQIMRRLFAGETVTHEGLVSVSGARLWEIPDPAPALIVPALTPATAGRAAAWADGLITINQPHEALRELVGTYRENGGTGRAVLQVHLSWAPTQEEAAAVAREQWRNNAFSPLLLSDLPSVEHFEALGEHATDGAIARSVLISSDTGQHAQWLQEYAELGFDEIYLHHVGTEQQPFIDAFAEHVLPRLKA